MVQSKIFDNTSPERKEITYEEKKQEVIFRDKINKPITKSEIKALITEMKFSIKNSKNSLRKGKDYNPHMPKISAIGVMHPLEVFQEL